MQKWKVLIIGMGERGKVHLYGFLENSDRFQVVGLCNRDRTKAEEALDIYELEGVDIYQDIDCAMALGRPDIVAVCLPPSLRLEIIRKIAVYPVKGIMLEKPMALSVAEAREITKICELNNIKAAVCHQHKYLKNFQMLKEALDGGELGEIIELRASCRAWSAQLGTHYIDYMMWLEQYEDVLSVAAHIHGNMCLKDSHPSPDYLMGQMAFADGVRGIIECGYFTRPHSCYQQGEVKGPDKAEFWTDDRLTVNGTNGYAYAELNGKFAKLTSGTRGELVTADFPDFFQKQQYFAQTGYTREFGEWIAKERDNYTCDIRKALRGYEVMESMYYSALDRTRVDLPLCSVGRDAIDEMRRKLKPVDYIQL